MSSETERVRVELERLKSKYKREALRAIATASEEAYDRGRKDERESSAARGDLLLNSPTGDSVREHIPRALVQYVVEHIYRGLKDEMSEDAQLSVPKLKAVLRKSAETMVTDLPASLRSGPASTSATDNERYLSIPRIAPPQRHLQIHACNILEKVYLVSIRDVTDNVVKGLFVDGQYVSYSIETDVVDLRTSLNSGPPQRCRYQVDRRASEVKALEQRVSKDLSLSMVPPVPSRNHRVVALSRNPQRPGKHEQKAQYRRRMYAQWLQYVANIAGLRGASHLETFLGVAPERATAVGQDSTQGGKVSELALHAEAFASAGMYERGSAATCIRERTQIFLRTDLRFDSGDAALYSEPGEDPADVRDKGRARVFSLQSAAFRDLKYADRELQLLQPLAAAAVEACQDLLGRWCERGFELRAMGENLLAWRSLEPADSVEHLLLGAVTDRLAQMSGAEEAVGTALQTELLEPMAFLHGDCVQAARDCVDDTLRRHPPSTFMPSAPYYCAEEGRHRGNGLPELRRVQEAIAAAGQTAASWDACRRLRGAMTVQQLLNAASRLAEQHRAERLVWEESLGALRRINVAAAVGADAGTDPQHRNSASAPALQGTSECLRQMVHSELHELSEASEHALARTGRNSSLAERKSDGIAPRDSNGATVPTGTVVDKDLGLAGQEADFNSAAVTRRNGGGSAGCGSSGAGSAGLVKALGGLASLKSVRALFTRATVPSGRRRSPSVCKPVGLAPPSDEDALAAHYNNMRDVPRKRTDLSTEGDRDRSRPPVAHEPDVLLQQDQRQHRVAARRQATAHGHTHTAHTAAHIRVAAASQAPAAEAFVAAPAPAAAVQIHPVFAPSDAAFSPPHTGLDPPVLAQPHKHGGVTAQSRRDPSASLGPESRLGEERARGSGDNSDRRVAAAEPSPPVAEQEHAADLSGEMDPGAPVPVGWVEVPLDDGTVYYYHAVTRVSRWDKPTEDVTAALEARIQQANAQVDEALQRHKEERMREQQVLMERESQAEQLKAKVKNAVDVWAFGRALGLVAPRVPAGAGTQPHPQGPAPRDLLLLLSTLHQLLPYIPGPDAVLDSAALPQPPTLSTCPSSEVRKAYMRAVRFVHPDKLPDDISLEAQMRAEAAFIILTDEFNKYRSGTST